MKTIRLTKTLLLLIGLFMTPLVACKKNDPKPNPDDPVNPTNGFNVEFQNSTFTGSVLVTYTDGSTHTANADSGKFIIPLSSSKDKTIASLQPQDKDIILIGRKEGTDIKLNYNGGVLQHRVSIGGNVPIGTYAEFVLIKKNSTTLSASYKLETDLDFMSINWTPIGVVDSPFTGNFDGGNFKISNLKIKSSSDYVGLFGLSDNNANFQNIIIHSGEIESLSGSVFPYTGSILGVDAHASATITNCINYASIKGKYCSGIAGEHLKSIFDCNNYGKIEGTVGAAGIVIGRCNKISNCKNFGSIKGSEYLAGIGGAKEIENCTNTGNLKGTTNTNGYGIGLASNKIENCQNIGTFSGGFKECSGITRNTPFIYGCLNTANITATDNAAGIAIHISRVGTGGGDIIISNCYNTGNITSTVNGGISAGIAGYVALESIAPAANIIEVKNCYNTGSIYCSASGYAGGLFGMLLIPLATHTISISGNYWRDNAGDNAEYSIGGYASPSSAGVFSPANIGANLFSATSWPSSAEGWLIGSGSGGAYWKSLGSWNSGSPVYPKLWFED